MAERFQLTAPLQSTAPGMAFTSNQKVEITGIARFGCTEQGDLCFCDREPPATQQHIAAGTIILCTQNLSDILNERFPEALSIPLADPRSAFIDLGHRLLAENSVEVSSRIPRPFSRHPSVKIGANTSIHPETCIEEGVSIGSQCVIHRGTWLRSGTIIRDHTVIGVEGINAYRGQDGKQRNFPHFGSVIIHENVEIGAGTVVARGILDSTSIGRETVIGNLSNIGHAVEIGDNVWMSVGCLIGGHTRIGNGATFGMGATVRDNIEIGERAQIGMGSVVVRPVPADTSVFGNPARALGAIQAGPVR